MNELIKLIEVTERLLGPEGCPWDREQTLKSARTYVLEEVCELIEAIDLEDDEHIKEELGDLFYNAVFLSKLAEKEGRCSMEEVLVALIEKLIRRHPHVFAGVSLGSSEEIVRQWEEIKKSENGKQKRTSLLDGIPKGLPSLSRAYKIAGRLAKKANDEEPLTAFQFDGEEELGKLLLDIVNASQRQGVDPEHALRNALAREEQKIRNFEKGIQHES